ncbi:DUF2591 domain-containing protein [Pantoea agglomerans]|uniref:phage protein NinX family protein n=1 Tax=Enterobacter agglomerans TaxID=549 RepID=UPI001F3EA7F1|nr:phage protein NinX family protein [Pantoea agglomerans]UIL51541.1 DUF2591 domain-containing protein [Pantoea agglomerans]
MNYSEMKDHEINAAVGEAMGWNAEFIHQDDSVMFRDDLGRLRGRKSYCNSWADAGPIIEKYRITMNAQFGGWFCFVSTAKTMKQLEEGNHHFSHMHGNPLRAAMIVFLMMQEQPNA